MLTLILPLILLVLLLVIRYLAIDPGFGIKTRAAGTLALWLAIGPRDIVYGDIDRLGLLNDALTTGQKAGHDRVNEVLRHCLRQMRRADVALVYGGDELRWAVAARSGRGFCHRFQQVLMDAPLTDEEKIRVAQATGKPYITITLAFEPSRGVLTHQRALDVAKCRVQGAKPKSAPGRRGEVIA